MSWRDYGVVFTVNQLQPWAASHCYVPTAMELPGRIRVFAAFWDQCQYGRLGSVDFAATDPTRVLSYSHQPLMPDAPAGSFDADGVTPLSVIRNGAEVRLYYAGWKRHPDPAIRYQLFTGLALSDDDGLSFTRYSANPVIGPNTPDCHVRTGGVVLREAQGFRCWFAQQEGTLMLSGKAMPSYHLATTTSIDGINWTAPTHIALPVIPGVIFGYGRSAIWRSKNGQYHGLFSVRRVLGGYTAIEYASSVDGLHWSQPDPSHPFSFPNTATADKQLSVCFPSFIFQSGGILMFYNGDGFGAAGLRLAVWEGDWPV